ncbi:stage II sporulation protein M [Paenibacillus sp. IHBB 10380]|uniref:stage II sporulation protein M n=1 Tax=Paenibacillus sp. IHBB 10380 TaxID=1566358 RepID=UPI0005CFD668|nr:stage II sporulation protein M [Paenibacillus sp. IHBB 10380]AJS60241.1 membrane protein [Paenibacillus sp. IHBB 10380]
MFRISMFIKDLRFIKKTILLSIILFVIGIIVGWISTGAIEKIILSQISGIQHIANNLSESSHPQWSFFKFIFLNNSIKGVLIIYLGAFFGILPIVFLVINGMVIGYLVHASALEGINMFDLIVKGLLPHGIIEIPAIIIACAFGLRFGMLVIISMTQWNQEKRAKLGGTWEHFMKRVGPISIWIVIMLFIAAIIESTFTFWLMK